MGTHTRGKLLAVATALLLVFAAVFNVSAQSVSFSYDDGAGTPDAGTYAPGSSFTFGINMLFTSGGSIANVEGVSYWFQQSVATAPFNFAITNRDLSASFFSFPQTSPANLTYPQNMTPANAKDLGGSTEDGSGVPSGSYFIANVTFSISASAAPGTYFIENTTTSPKASVIADTNGHTFAIPQAIYTITVVPEPGSIALLGIGSSIAGLVRLRRRWSRL